MMEHSKLERLVKKRKFKDMHLAECEEMDTGDGHLAEIGEVRLVLLWHEELEKFEKNGFWCHLVWTKLWRSIALFERMLRHQISRRIWGHPKLD